MRRFFTLTLVCLMAISCDEGDAQKEIRMDDGYANTADVASCNCMPDVCNCNCFCQPCQPEDVVTDGIVPVDSEAPEDQVVLPEDMTPPPEDVTPPPEDTTPPPEDVTPPPEDTTPPPEDTTPPPEDTTPPPEDVTPPPEDTTPPPEDTTPPPEDVTPPEDVQLEQFFITVYSDPLGANFYIDDESKGVTPFNGLVLQGLRTFRFEFEGCDTLEVERDIQGIETYMEYLNCP